MTDGDYMESAYEIFKTVVDEGTDAYDLCNKCCDMKYFCKYLRIYHGVTGCMIEDWEYKNGRA